MHTPFQVENTCLMLRQAAIADLKSNINEAVTLGYVYRFIISRDNNTLAHRPTEALNITGGVQNCITVRNIPGKGPVICNILPCCAENLVSQLTVLHW